MSDTVEVFKHVFNKFISDVIWLEDDFSHIWTGIGDYEVQVNAASPNRELLDIRMWMQKYTKQFFILLMIFIADVNVQCWRFDDENKFLNPP